MEKFAEACFQVNMQKHEGNGPPLQVRMWINGMGQNAKNIDVPGHFWKLQCGKMDR